MNDGSWDYWLMEMGGMTSLRHCIGVISFGSTMIRIGHVHYNTENREQRTA
jgi:hypothetical protein